MFDASNEECNNPERKLFSQQHRQEQAQIQAQTSVQSYTRGTSLGYKPSRECREMTIEGYCCCRLRGPRRKSCIYDNYYWAKNGELLLPVILAPQPNGECYCGRQRDQCLNFIKYGKDCQGFKGVDHFRKN